MVYLPLPDRPSEPDELREDQLESVAGGVSLGDTGPNVADARIARDLLGSGFANVLFLPPPPNIP